MGDSEITQTENMAHPRRAILDTGALISSAVVSPVIELLRLLLALIAAEKVNGTKVYNPAGETLGSMDDIMIDKVNGRAIYAVMSFGGFLGIGEKFHPLPWATLKYDAQKGGYVVNLDKEIL